MVPIELLRPTGIDTALATFLRWFVRIRQSRGERRQSQDAACCCEIISAYIHHAFRSVLDRYSSAEHLIDTFEYRLFVSSVSTNLLSRISRVLAVINPILVTTAATVKISGIQVLVPRTLVQWYEQTELITVRISNAK